MIWKKHSYTLVLIAVSIVIRTLLFIFTDPVITKDASDPGGYISVANNISSLDFSDYDGGRTPGYPFIISLAGFNYAAVVLLQMCMGILIGVLLLKITHRLTGNKPVSFLAGLSYSLYLPFLNREILIATETAAIFFLTLSFYLFLLFLSELNNKKISYLFLLTSLGAASITALIRPLYLLLYYFLAAGILFVLLIKNTDLKKIIPLMLLILLPNLVFIQGWSFVNYQTTGKYCLSSWSGMSLSNKAGMFMESAPEEYDALKKHFIRHRDEKLSSQGTHLLSAWLAFEDMQEETGLSDAELIEQIKRMSIAAIKEEPGLYLKGVIADWFTFWKPIGLYQDYGRTASVIKLIEHRALWIVIFLFFGYPVFYLFARRFRKSGSLSFEHAGLTSVFYLLVLACSGACAILELGNRRFSLVTDPLLIIIVVTLIYNFWTSVYFSPVRLRIVSFLSGGKKE